MYFQVPSPINQVDSPSSQHLYSPPHCGSGPNIALQSPDGQTILYQV